MDYGAKGDGRTRDTIAIQKAIEACGRAGGGTVLVPKGKFLTGALNLTSNMVLLVEVHATLLGSEGTLTHTPLCIDGSSSR